MNEVQVKVMQYGKGPDFEFHFHSDSEHFEKEMIQYAAQELIKIFAEDATESEKEEFAKELLLNIAKNLLIQEENAYIVTTANHKASLIGLINSF